MELDNSSAADGQLRRRLADALRRGLSACGGVQSQLIEEIEKANAYVDGLTVERRKIPDLIFKDLDVKFSTRELQALDTYFIKNGLGGLSGVLSSHSILRSLANTGQAAFLLGARPGAQFRTNSVSSWDLRSVTHIVRGIDSVATGVHFDIQDVLLRERTQIPQSTAPQEFFSAEDWHQLITQRNGPNIISLASSRVNHGSELLLSAMLGLDPYSRPEVEGGPLEAPFQMWWEDDDAGRIPSRFIMDRLLLSDGSAYSASTRKYSAALRLHDEIFTVDYEASVRDEYGLIVCQRRKDGRIFLCIAGLTGTSTYATAMALSTAPLVIPFDDSPHPPVLWGLAKARVVTQEGIPGDGRLVSAVDLVQTGVWEPLRKAKS